MHLSNVSPRHDLPLQMGLFGQPTTSGTPSMSADKNNFSQNSSIKNILIADDSNTERMHLKKLLESAGYVVTEVDSGSKAFEIAKRDAPDLILLDIIMENGDGYQTCRQLKREPETNEIPVIMVSSKHNDVDRKWALKLGALDYIVKPYSDEALIQRLSEI